MAWGVVMTAEGDVAREDGGSAAHHVGLHDAGADVDESHRFLRDPGMVELELVLDGEGVEIHHERLESRLFHHGHVLEDLDLLHRHQDHGHGVGGLTDDLIVEKHVVDGEGDVVLGLEGDGVRQLLRGHLGQRHSLHDRLTSGDGDHGRRALDARFLHALLHRVAHERGFLDRALADYIVREWNLSECGQPPGATFALLQLDDFDRAGPDVESEGRRLLSQSEPLHAGSPIYELTCSSVKSTDASTTL